MLIAFALLACASCAPLPDPEPLPADLCTVTDGDTTRCGEERIAPIWPTRGRSVGFSPAESSYAACMIVIDSLAALSGALLIWVVASGRLSTLVTDVDTGRDVGSGVGNIAAIGAGACVMMSVLL